MSEVLAVLVTSFLVSCLVVLVSDFEFLLLDNFFGDVFFGDDFFGLDFCLPALRFLLFFSAFVSFDFSFLLFLRLFFY